MESGVVHDSSNYYDDGECPTNPDIAGLGVVLTYAFAAILTTAASVAAAYLDEVLQADTAFLPNRLNAYMSKNQDQFHLHRCKFWRAVLERLVLALADQQLVTGFAILITGLIVYHEDRYGAHFTLVVYLSSLSSSSHLAAIITLRKYFSANPALALLRIVLITAFALVLAVSIMLSSAFVPFYAIYWYAVRSSDIVDVQDSLGIATAVWPILWVFWTGIWQIVPDIRNHFTAWIKRKLWLPFRGIGLLVPEVRLFRRLSSSIQYRLPDSAKTRLRRAFRATLHYMVFLSPGSVFVLQILFAAISVALALAQKFSPGEGTDKCSLNSKKENQMGYGQILAFLMLILILIATIEAYKEQENVMRNEAASSSASSLVVAPALNELQPGDQNFPAPQRQDTEQRIGTQSLPAASLSLASLAASFVSAVDQQPPQAQSFPQRQDTQQTASTTRLPNLAVTSAMQPEIEMKVLQRKNTI